MTVTVKNGQTLADIAIQEYGSLEAVTLLASANNVSPSATLQTGTELYVPEQVFDKEMQDYCKNNNVSPATETDEYGEIKLRIFTKQFTKEFM